MEVVEMVVVETMVEIMRGKSRTTKTAADKLVAAVVAAPSTTAGEPVLKTGLHTIKPASMNGTSPSGVPWSIRTGDVLVIDRGPQQ